MSNEKNVITPQEIDRRYVYPVWRYRVCGYLCATETPPDTCPICKATKERFEQFV